MKLKNAAYILLGFTLSWVLSSLLDINHLIYVTIIVPFLLIGILHELLHLMAINIFGIRYKFTIKGLYIGFIINVDKRGKYILTALFPQILTLLMILLYIFTLNKAVLTLSILHIAISVEDLGKCIKYIFLQPDYFLDKGP